jgi:hypothetical protein
MSQCPDFRDEETALQHLGRTGGLDSDHVLLRIKLRIAAFMPKTRREENPQEEGNAAPSEEILREKRIRIDWKKLYDDSQLKEKFNEKLDALILEKGLSTTDISSWEGSSCFFDTFTELIELVSQEVAPAERKTKCPLRFQMREEELLDAISERNKVAAMHMRNPDPLTKTKFASARKHVKRVVKEAKNRWMETKLEEIENYRNQPRNHWKSAREIVDGYTNHRRKPKVIKMKKADGSLASNDEESAQVFKDHFEKNVFNLNEESSYEDSIFNEIDPIPHVIRNLEKS